MLRWPVRVPVRTSFGVMHDRPAVLVRVEDGEGAFGWGEAWCNFPSCGAEHRARLIETVLAPLVVGRAFASPQAAFDELTRADRGAGHPVGRAGADRARRSPASTSPCTTSRRGAPDCRCGVIFATRPARLRARRRRASAVYASGINPERPGDTVAALRRAGYTRVQAEGRLRRGARRRQPRRRARRRRRRAPT